MSFLAPLFLAALAAVAIPVLVHLTHKERKEPQVFPSLMFLQRIPFKTRRLQRIRHWLLFALRAAAVMLLVAAFARPFFSRGGDPSAGGRSVVVLLDRSASMGAAGRWARAQREVRTAIAALEPGAVMTLIAFDDRAEAVARHTADRPSLEGAAARVAPGSAAGRFGPALRLAASLLEERGGEGEVVVVSDFPQRAWTGDEAGVLPAGTRLTTRDVGDSTLASVAVTSVVLEHGADGRTTVTARIVATGGGPRARTVPVTLEVAGRDVQTVRVSAGPAEPALARFDAIRDPEEPRRSRVRVPADDLPADDAHHFVLGPAPRLPVLLVTRPGARPGDALYLRQALTVARDPALPVTTRAANAVRAADLDGAAVVVLHDVPFPGGETGRRLLERLRESAGLLVALGAQGSLPGEIGDSLGPALRPTDRAETGAAAAAADATHPVYAGWDGSRGDPFAGSRTFRYRPLERARTALARFDDGTAALAAVRVGSGRVLVWGADLANRWSDLPLQPGFVPLMHGATRWLAGYAPAPTSFAVGEVAELARPAAGSLVLERPDGRREALDQEGPARVRLDASGFWMVRGAAERAQALLLAANVPTEESDPARLDPAHLGLAVAGGVAAAPQTVSGPPVERERRQRLWWFMLASVLVLLAAETVIAQRTRGIIG